jgi:hemoglobin
MRNLPSIILAAAVLLAAGCAQQPAPAPQYKSLYDRLGQQPGLVVVVDEFVANIAADPRINQRFAKTDIPKLKAHLVDQLCVATGGPCRYTGRDMVTTHKGMNITTAEFNATGEAMLKALQKYKVAQADIDAVMGALGGMQNDIVGK